jgi:hypothetical protein
MKSDLTTGLLKVVDRTYVYPWPRVRGSMRQRRHRAVRRISYRVIFIPGRKYRKPELVTIIPAPVSDQ